MIYLDYNATAPIRKEVVEKVADFMLSQPPANASSAHSAGRNAKKHLENSRKIIAESLSCFPNEVTFTSTGTEANNLAIKGFCSSAINMSRYVNIVVSAIEHASIIKTAEQIAQHHILGNKINLHYLPVLPSGIVNITELEKTLHNISNEEETLVSIMLANNETGVIQPIPDIATVVHEHNAILHCDAIQAFGKIPIDAGLLGADILSISSHKIGGTHGAAALITRQDVEAKYNLEAQTTGGGQEAGKRAGTENIAAIIGFAEAAKMAIDEMSSGNSWQHKIRKRLDKMETAIKTELPEIHILGKDAPSRLPNTSAIMFPNISAEIQLINMDLENIAISAGSACSSGKISVSHVAKAMGVSHPDCVIRISAGWNSTSQDIEIFTRKWLEMVNKITKKPQKY